NSCHEKKLGSCERGSEERRPGRFSYFTFLRWQVDLDPAIDGYGFQYPCTPELCRINYHTSIRGNTGRFIHLRAGHHIEGAALEILHRHMEFSVAAMHICQVAPVRGDIRPCILGPLEAQATHCLVPEVELVDLGPTSPTRREHRRLTVRQPARFRINRIMCGLPLNFSCGDVENIDFRVAIAGQRQRQLLSVRRPVRRTIDSGEAGYLVPLHGRQLMYIDRWLLITLVRDISIHLAI